MGGLVYLGAEGSPSFNMLEFNVGGGPSSQSAHLLYVDEGGSQGPAVTLL